MSIYARIVALAIPIANSMKLIDCSMLVGAIKFGGVNIAKTNAMAVAKRKLPTCASRKADLPRRNVAQPSLRLMAHSMELTNSTVLS